MCVSVCVLGLLVLCPDANSANTDSSFPQRRSHSLPVLSCRVTVNDARYVTLEVGVGGAPEKKQQNNS